MIDTIQNKFSFFVLAAFLIPYTVHAEITDSDQEISCPDAIYRGSLKIAFADENLADQTFQNMLFFYGKKPAGKAGKNKVQLKSIMICTSNADHIDIVTKYIGKYDFPLQGECGLYLNGAGKIDDDTLFDTGAVKLHCKDNLVYAGEYSITAELL